MLRRRSNDSFRNPNTLGQKGAKGMLHHRSTDSFQYPKTEKGKSDAAPSKKMGKKGSSTNSTPCVTTKCKDVTPSCCFTQYFWRTGQGRHADSVQKTHNCDYILILHRASPQRTRSPEKNAVLLNIFEGQGHEKKMLFYSIFLEDKVARKNAVLLNIF